MSAANWSCGEVRSWLIDQGFEEYSELLCDQHEVDGEVLLSLTEIDLKTPPLQIKKLSHIKKLFKCIRSLIEKEDAYKYRQISNLKDSRLQRSSIRKSSSFQRAFSDSSDAYSESDGTHFVPDYYKFFASVGYAFISSWITAFTMVLVHERVPDMTKYPPLPDIFLDNVPLIPDAFKLAEVCGLILCLFWIAILICHKHRFIILRRFFSITSTIFLLRSVTMFVTSLSVPGKHLSCSATSYPSMAGRIERATNIVLGLGMSLTGVHTCGDYLFSGHTAYLTLFNHFITEYTPSRLYHLHTASWVLNLFGIFFVLAAHEHYSIDVVIAFYIASRIFLYYHMLANTRSYSRSRRIRYLFPLFSFFECNVPGKVPNEFEVPLKFAAAYLKQILRFDSMTNQLYKKK